MDALLPNGYEFVNTQREIFYAQYTTPQRRGECLEVLMSSIESGNEPSYQQVLCQMGEAGGLGRSLGEVHTHLCFAIKKSRESGLFELEGGLTGLQTELEGLIARLQPTLLFQAQQPV